jgi:hypothetical protein
MVIGVLLIVLGALGPIAGLQWRTGRWLQAAAWVARNASVHVLYATPMAGLFLSCLGLSIIWPPAITLVFLAAGAFLWALLASPYRRRIRAAKQSEPEQGGRAVGLSGPASSRGDLARRTDRRGSTTRRPVTGRPGNGPAQVRRDARRAG